MTAASMPAQLQSLQCPACGHPGSDILGEHAFGAKLHCSACGTTSALVTNRQVYVQKTGDRTCGGCGRANPLRTRFCQCGRNLQRDCLQCIKTFHCDDKVCPHCGWNHDPSLGDEAVINQCAAALNEALDQRRSRDLGHLVDELLAAFLQRNSLTKSAERALMRLVLSGYEHGASQGSLNRWRSKLGMVVVNSWYRRLEVIYKRREQLASALKPGGSFLVSTWVGHKDRALDELARRSDSVELSPSWFLFGTGVLLWMTLSAMDHPGWGFILAVISSLLSCMFRNQGPNQGEETFTGSLKQAKEAADTQWLEWLREYDIPPRPSNSSKTRS